MERTRGGYWIKGLGIGIGMALGLLASAGQAQAQVTCEWRGKATTAEWSEPDNWVQPACGGVPLNEVPVTVIFPRGANTVASRSTNNISTLTLSGLILQGTTAFRDGWLITGDRDDPITVTGNVSVDSETDRNGFGPNILAP